MTEIPIAIRGDIEARAVDQLRRCAEAGDAVAGAICADGHVGYSQPIGGVVAYPDHISPSGVGYDIACLAAGTPVTTDDGCRHAIERLPVGATATCWDGARTRRIDPLHGIVAKGARPTLRIRTADDREILLTSDHEVRTPLGWRAAGTLVVGDRVGVGTFVGLAFEPARETLAVPTPDAQLDRLVEPGLWPVRADDPRFPTLLRVLAYCAGDGWLAESGYVADWCTSVEADAQDIADDLGRLGFRARIYRRERGGNVRVQYDVRVRSRALNALLHALGCPRGRKATAWPAVPFAWLDALPAWQRAVFLSAFASAEATTPALIAHGGLAPVAIKQAATHSGPIELVARLLTGLGFTASITRSGRPAEDGVTCHVCQVLGGDEETLRFFREVGFNRAIDKRVAAARCLGIACERRALRAARVAAIAEAQALKAAGGTRVRDIVAAVSEAHDVPPALVHHGMDGRGAPRVPKGARPCGDHSNEIAWLPITRIDEGGVHEVYDLVTGDPARAFFADGVVVHNCGNKAARTDVLVDDVRGDLPRVMDEIFERVSFGVGRSNAEPVDHPVLDEIARAEFRAQRQLVQMARNQLGTVGAGNHYVDLFAGDDGFIWVGVHFGSRGFGHKTASGFLALAAGRRFDERGPDGEMDSPPVLLAIDSELGRDYIAAMELAGRYAYAGRDVVVDKVLEILGAQSTYEVHNHHNFAWRERHFNTDVWVIRKGCTPAFPGQEGFVGATMGEPSVILRGTDDPAGAALLHSTVHGAGRVMSRTQAAGRMGNRAECTERDCDTWVSWAQYRHERERAGVGEHDRFTLCPKHPEGAMAKRRGRIKTGLIDFDVVQQRLAGEGIELRGGAADEAPDAYKRLDVVLAAHGPTIEVVHRLQPIGVAMAGADTFDPYKD